MEIYAELPHGGYVNLKCDGAMSVLAVRALREWVNFNVDLLMEHAIEREAMKVNMADAEWESWLPQLPTKKD